jgi:hypothetical protein
MNKKYKSMIREIDEIHDTRRKLNTRENILHKKISILKTSFIKQ